MKANRRARVAGVVAAGVLATAAVGTAVAQQQNAGADGSYYQDFTARVARILGKQPAEVRSAMQQAQTQMVDQAVSQGTMTKPEADKAKQQLQNGAPFAGVRAVAAEERERNHAFGVVKSVSGSTLVVQTRQGDRTVVLDTNTRIQQAGQAADRSALKAGVFVIVKGTASGDKLAAERIQVKPMHGLANAAKHAGIAELQQIADYLGLTPQQLVAELAQGKSLADMAGPAKTPGLITRIEELVRTRVNEAVKSGRIDQTRADTILKNLHTRVTTLVNQKGLHALVGKGKETGLGRGRGNGHARGWMPHRGADSPADDATATPSGGSQ